jgi:uncharacterized membrane protein YozB (DUF420 family)
LHSMFFTFIYSINLIYVSISIIIILFNKKLILKNKFSKHSQVNITSCKIKYLNLYVSRFF